MRESIPSLAGQYGRYGYRRVTVLLRNEGWLVNHKRVQRIWCQEGLKVPTKQSNRGRLWLSDGSIVRLQLEFPKHVWSYDFMQDRTHDGRPFRILNVIDEFTRECLAVRVKRGLAHQDVLKVLTNLFCERGKWPGVPWITQVVWRLSGCGRGSENTDSARSDRAQARHWNSARADRHVPDRHLIAGDPRGSVDS